MTSKHWRQDRKERADLIGQIGMGEMIKEVEIDKGHKNGPEIHAISSTGIITIFNKRTHRMITQLIARPKQLKRYFKYVPQDLWEIAIEHQKLGYNLI